MKIKLNGVWNEIDSNATLEEIIQLAQKNNPYYIVAVNYECIQPQEYKNIKLKDGDEVEVLSPMQGG